MKNGLVTAAILSLGLLYTTSSFAECSITMAYKDGGKEPLITKKPKHDGVYFDLFQEAAKRIGCTLKVSRSPKKRLHAALKAGELDFYPGASFSKKRAEYLYYAPNGLETGQYGVTNIGVGDLPNYESLKKLDVYWLMELGSSKKERAKALGIKTEERKYYDLEIVSLYIKRKPEKNFFYVADKELVDYFPTVAGTSIGDAGLQIHKGCCGGDQPMLMGFSRFSPHFKEAVNPDYDKNKDLSPMNFPTIVDPESNAAKLAVALVEMKKEGVSASIYKKWFAGN